MSWGSHSPGISCLLEALPVQGDDCAITQPGACTAHRQASFAALGKDTAALRQFGSPRYTRNSPVCVLYSSSAPEPGARSLLRPQLKWQTLVFLTLQKNSSIPDRRQVGAVMFPIRPSGKTERLSGIHLPLDDY